ncbi:MAG: IPT/TIG domain-containing protein [Blastocatellia bacterium]
MKRSTGLNGKFLRLLVIGIGLIGLGSLGGRLAHRSNGVRAAVSIQNSVPVTTVSAASYAGGQSPLAPGSIVAAFGTLLATGTLAASSQPLPTSLLNTTVTVNGISAQIFFVSAGQINYLLPAGLPAGLTDGESEVVVTAVQPNGDEIVSRGTVRIAPTAPSIFTADASGTGAPAGLTGRINQNGQFAFDSTLPFSADPVNPGRLIPAPIDVGTAQYPAFLILYGTGIRNAAAGTVRVVIGGVETPVEYSGSAPGFTGLDQINVRLPVSLKGSGLVDLTAVVNGVSSNAITLNLAGTSSSTLSISGFSVSAPVVAGETISIDGNGFSAVTNENIVRFGGAQARVISASASQLTVIVPFGAESGQVVIQSKGVEARSGSAFRIKTSISGIVQTTGSSTSSPAPLNDVTVRLAGTNASVRTNPQGTFVLSDIPDGVSLVEIDGGTNVSTPPFPSVTLKMTARADRDNQVAQPISLQQISGGSGNVGTATSGESGTVLTAILNGLGGAGFGSLVGRERNEVESKLLEAAVREQLAPQAGSTQISDRGVTLDVPVTTVVKFPDGRSTGTLQVTVIEKSRLPGIVLPTGVYSSMIAQITPIGASFSPGASITFPNPDATGLAAGSRVDLYRYDSTAGVFVKRGAGIVSSNRTQVVSDGRVVDAGGFWLAAVASSVTTVTGRVIDSSGNPVAGSKVTVNGRATISDQNGGFSLPDVATVAGASVQVEAVVPQQFGTPPRGTSSQTPSIKGGITNVGQIALSSTNQPGLVMWPLALDLTAGSKATTISITLTQPAPTRGLVINLLSVNPGVAAVPVSVTIPAGKTTTSFTATPTGTGNSLIEAVTLLNGATVDGAAAVSVSQPGPTLTGISPTSAPEGSIVIITGNGLSNVAMHHYVSFYRNGQLLTYLPPSEIRVVRDASNKAALQIRVPKVGAGAVTVDVAVVDTKTGVLSDPSAPVGLTILQKTIPIPKLSGLTPSQGPPRSQVTINGTGFNPNAKLNSVRFVSGVQRLPAVVAEIKQASPGQLVVTVPSTGLPTGKATIIARVLDETGAESGDSNALSFTVTTTTIDPPGKPILSKLTNRSTGDSSGKEGDLMVATGSGFGLNYFDPDKEAFVGSEKVISVFRYYQNNRIANITFPMAASGGTTLVTTVPSGLQKGTVQVTVTNYDLETDTPGLESQFSNFGITEGTPLRLREAEPNDTVGQASELIFPSILEGDITKGEPGEIIHRYPNGDLLPLADVYRISVMQRISGVIELSWLPGADLDLILLRKNSQGIYEPVTVIGKRSGESESISGTLTTGEYIIGIGAWSGRSVYTLSLQTTTGPPNNQ